MVRFDDFHIESYGVMPVKLKAYVFVSPLPNLNGNKYNHYGNQQSGANSLMVADAWYTDDN